MKPGDEVLFAGKRYTLIERWNSEKPLWLVVETDNPRAEMRYLVEEEIARASQA